MLIGEKESTRFQLRIYKGECRKKTQKYVNDDEESM
jgi:hypothetical protein